jgi:hypothetical protein
LVAMSESNTRCRSEFWTVARATFKTRDASRTDARGESVKKRTILASSRPTASNFPYFPVGTIQIAMNSGVPRTDCIHALLRHFPLGSGKFDKSHEDQPTNHPQEGKHE